MNAPILILSQPPETAIPLLLAYKVMPSVYTSEFAIQYAEAADAFGVRAVVAPLWMTDASTSAALANAALAAAGF